MTDFCAEDALEARQRNPRAAIEMARVVLRATEDRSEWAIAERAIGLALRELSDDRGAVRHLRRSIRIATDASLPRLAAIARVSLAWVLGYMGKHRAALRALDLAVPELSGSDAVAALKARGIVFHYLCHYDEAKRDYTAAISGARRVGDKLVEARALNNRGLIRAYCGDMREASADFTLAAELMSESARSSASPTCRGTRASWPPAAVTSRRR